MYVMQLLYVGFQASRSGTLLYFFDDLIDAGINFVINETANEIIQFIIFVVVIADVAFEGVDLFIQGVAHPYLGSRAGVDINTVAIGDDDTAEIDRFEVHIETCCFDQF